MSHEMREAKQQNLVKHWWSLVASYVSELGHHSLRQWFGTYSMQRHYQNKCWLLYIAIFIQENTFKNVVYKMSAILLSTLCAKHAKVLMLLVLTQEYSGKTGSIPWLLMTWLFASPGHQQPRYWLCRINWFLSEGRFHKFRDHFVYVPSQ